MNERNIELLQDAIKNAWSIKSSSKWTIQNPAKGHCGVTALVVNDHLGGEIFKTRLPEGWHFYNIIEHQRYDFTLSQFSESIIYEDILSNRNEAFMDCNEKQYMYLKQKVSKNFKKEADPFSEQPHRFTII